MNRVIVFRSDLLPYSETFIKAQVQSLKRWRPVLVGYRRDPGGLPLDGLDVRFVFGHAMSTLQRRALRFCQMLDIAHLPTVRTFRQIGADLVHVHFGPDAVDVWPSVRKLGLPMLVTLHGYDINIHREWWEAGHGGFRRRSYPERLLRLAQEPTVHFIAVSKAIRARAIEYGIPADKVTIRYIGVDTIAFNPGQIPINERADRILFIGRLIENKGASILIRAFAVVKKRIKTAQLVIIGDGLLRRNLEELSKSLNISPTFLGSTSNDEVRNQLHMAKILCQPSITIGNGASEAFGIVILEAQAAGVPVISSAKGGAFEGMLEGRTGFRFDEQDVDNLANLLEKVLSESGTLQQMSVRAIDFVSKNFKLGSRTRQLEALYSKYHVPANL